MHTRARKKPQIALFRTLGIAFPGTVICKNSAQRKDSSAELSKTKRSDEKAEFLQATERKSNCSGHLPQRVKKRPAFYDGPGAYAPNSPRRRAMPLSGSSVARWAGKPPEGPFLGSAAPSRHSHDSHRRPQARSSHLRSARTLRAACPGSSARNDSLRSIVCFACCSRIPPPLAARHQPSSISCVPLLFHCRTERRRGLHRREQANRHSLPI